jgi:large conductance mechanosensitive channel
MGIKNMLAEFKAFAFKGNMIDLAVAVVIGAAFSNVIQAMVKDIINPAISYAVTGVKEAHDTATSMTHPVTSKMGVTSQPATEPAAAPVVQTTTENSPPDGKAKEKPAPTDPTQAVNLDWKWGRFLIGDFLGAIINFIIQAFAVFLLIVKLSGTIVKKVGKPQAPSEPTTKECPYCLSAIPIKATKCSHCTADLPAGGPSRTMA